MTTKNEETNDEIETKENIEEIAKPISTHIFRKEFKAVKLLCNICYQPVVAQQISKTDVILMCPHCKWAEFKTLEEFQTLTKVEEDE